MSAFTLIELLVVIAIVSLLISLLAPSLGRARDAARGVGCASNLRQIGVVMVLFAADNRNYFPFYYTDHLNMYPHPTAGPEYGPDYQGFQWDAQLNPYLTLVEEVVRSPRNFNYPTQPTVFLCPSSTPYRADWTPGMICSYRYNGYLGRDFQNSGRLPSLNDPTRTVVVTELVHYATGTAWRLWGGAQNVTVGLSPLALPNWGVPYFHGGRTNILFGDFHVASRAPIGDLTSMPQNIRLYNGGELYP